MAITAYLYDNFPANCMRKAVSDMAAGGTTIKVALCTDDYTPDQATHSSYNDITDEVSGTGYTTGGAELLNKALTTSVRVTTFDADDISWPNSSITARYAIIYDATPSGGATSQKLIGYIDFGQDYTSSSDTFTIVFNSSGILSWTVA